MGRLLAIVEGVSYEGDDHGREGPLPRIRKGLSKAGGGRGEEAKNLSERNGNAAMNRCIMLVWVLVMSVLCLVGEQTWCVEVDWEVMDGSGYSVVGEEGSFVGLQRIVTRATDLAEPDFSWRIMAQYRNQECLTEKIPYDIPTPPMLVRWKGNRYVVSFLRPDGYTNLLFSVSDNGIRIEAQILPQILVRRTYLIEKGALLITGSPREKEGVTDLFLLRGDKLGRLAADITSNLLLVPGSREAVFIQNHKHLCAVDLKTFQTEQKWELRRPWNGRDELVLCGAGHLVRMRKDIVYYYPMRARGMRWSLEQICLNSGEQRDLLDLDLTGQLIAWTDRSALLGFRPKDSTSALCAMGLIEANEGEASVVECEPAVRILNGNAKAGLYWTACGEGCRGRVMWLPDVMSSRMISDNGDGLPERGSEIRNSGIRNKR